MVGWHFGWIALGGNPGMICIGKDWEGIGSEFGRGGLLNLRSTVVLGPA